MLKIHFLLFACLCFELRACAKYEHKLNPVIWKSKCTPRSYVLNDCNWCRCQSGHFYCESRACSKVDPFGHFNDAIQNMPVGMEGHGSWRTTATVCEPGVHYTRENLLCVCDGMGQWPNPTCRDTFRVLHSVQITEMALASTKQSCTPSKLYLIGCNVCFCPASGKIHPELCTTKICANDDPVILREELSLMPKNSEDEVYAECQADRKYILGCRVCTCISNNRLLCGPCIYESQKIPSACSKIRPRHIFHSDCNLCYCENDFSTCTVRRCLPKSIKPVTEIEGPFILTSKPIKDEECQPGTRYKKDCNTCYCSETESGVKTVKCTVKQCDVSLDKQINADCVEGSVFGISCLICTCSVEKGDKIRTCKVDNKCLIDKQPEPKVVSSLNGHCEPWKEYRNYCNNCTCLPGGKLVTCTSTICNRIEGRRGKAPMFRTVDVIPVKSNLHAHCPPGHSYKIDCNHCFCMKNGNVICTKEDCSKNKS